MLIPFIVIRDGELLNLANVVSVKQIAVGEGLHSTLSNRIELKMADGSTRTYTGDEFARVNAEIVFARNMYAEFQAGIYAARQAAGSQIVIPDLNRKSRVN